MSSPPPFTAPPLFFRAPSTGRRILAGFSHLQRIRKGAATNVWFPQKTTDITQYPVEWAAVRQFDILQESDNLHVYDMDVGDMKYALDNISKMRAGGYRITVITLGDYTSRHGTDDLLLLDQKLQEEITRMIHFLYLNEISAQTTAKDQSDIETGKWSLQNNLEHVALTYAAKKLYKPGQKTLAEDTFFKILALLSPNHIIHETGIGLQLPDATKEKIWVYVAKGENQLWRFQQAITAVFESLDKTRPVMTHMRGYGDHTMEGFSDWQKQCLEKLAA